MEDLLNTMLYLFRQGLYALVFGWMFASWFMINDSLNPKLKERMHGRLSCGVMLFIYTPMFLLNMFMNGIVAYLVVWSRMMGDNLRFPAGWDEENQQFIMESAGDVTGLR